MLENTEGGNQKWTIQRNTTHYVLDTTIHKQTQIM